MKRFLTAIGVVVGLTAAAPASAQAPIEHEMYRLDNGLRVILVQDHSTPIVTVDVWYNVGSRNEKLGRSGFAHLFEHMMFQGSENVGKADHMQLIQEAGGTMNGSTNDDRTNYYQTLPANRLNLGLWLEADRMRSLAVTQENFENQREVVKEERRLRIDNQPYVPAFVEGLTMLYDSTRCFPYAHTVIGSMDDLNAAEVPNVQAFFDLYYAPNNATLVVVGDFDIGDAKGLIQQYFDDIPRAGDPPPVHCEADYSPGAGEHTWEDPLANLPAVIIAFRAPPYSDPATRSLELLDPILGQGESSRLNRILVREKKTAFATFSFLNPRSGPGFYAVAAIANQGISIDTLTAQLREQVANILADGVTDEELEKAKNTFRARNIFGRQTTFQLAERVQFFAHYHESLDDINTNLDRYMATTVEDIRRAAARYLSPENSLTILVVPKEEEETAEEAPVP